LNSLLSVEGILRCDEEEEEEEDGRNHRNDFIILFVWIDDILMVGFVGTDQEPNNS
jgi:hypothetical protein